MSVTGILTVNFIDCEYKIKDDFLYDILYNERQSKFCKSTILNQINKD